MRNLIKNLSLVALLALGLPSARAYSPMGPLPGSTAPYEDVVGGEPWQTTVIGYPVNTYTFTIGFPGGPIILGYIGGPHNISEEYRRVTPTLYYAYDSQFLGYFGLSGTTNADYAFAIMNSVTNVSTYSAGLSEFPTASQQYNFTAQALYLTDLKSVTLHLLLEQLGLDEPERFTWTLHDRTIITTCPTTAEYLVVQRNFDVLDSPLNAVQYSPYVNGILYSYYISEVCSGSPILAETVPFSTDPTAQQYTAVAANNFDNFGGLQLGGFYNGLTADDVAGLRYLMSSNNINYESTVLSGGLLLVTNVQPNQTFGPTLPLSLLFSQAVTSDPNTLQTNYPGITFLSVTTNIVNQVTTNLSLFFTNLPGPYTNRVPLSNGVAVYPPGGTVLFTNWSPVQFSPAPLELSTLPLTPLLALAPTTDPATLQALYPGLLIDQVTTNYLSVVITTNIFGYYTNQSVPPVFSNSATGYPLRNFLTPTNVLYFTNQPGPTVIAYDNTQPFTTIQTLDLATFSDASATNAPAVMQALYPGLVIIRSTTSPAFIPVTNYISYLTNYVGTPFNGPPAPVTVPASVTYQWVTNWHHQFGNVFTNHFHTNRLVTTQSIWTTNQISAPFGSPFVTYTNYASVYTNKVSGDFFIYPTNWCGFDLTLAFPKQVAFGPTNNVVFAGFNSSGATNAGNPAGTNTFGLTQNTYDVWTNYNYAVYPGICEPVVQFGTNYTTNIVNTFSYDFVNVITNHYYTNSLVSLFITNVFIVPFGAPDQTATNIIQTNFYANIPSGDFYIVPPTWCGYQITALLTNFIVPTNIVFTNTTFGQGGANTVTNQQFTEVEYLSYTNYIYSVRPGTCEPAVATQTNYSTNIVTQYSYYFGSIITNNYFTNAPVITVTTNTAPVTNGPVGAVTNIVSTNIAYNGIGGDFFIIPPNFCSFTILSNQLSTVVTTTNTVAATNNNGVALLPGQQYTLTTYTRYTNSIFVVKPATCTTAPAPPALRRGIEHVQFVRASFDSLTGLYFAPITNYYTMVKITNSQPVTEYYQRVVTTPDILMTASDLAAGPSDITVDRTIHYDTSQVSSGLRGPGVIYGPVTFTYNKVGTAFQNGPFIETNGFINGISTITSVNQTSQVPVLQWASFDATTNVPVLYPSGESLTDLANAIVLQVSPTTVPDGTNNVPYNGGAGVQFTVSGGLAPFTWSAPGLSTQVPGLSFNPSTQKLSGTPLAPGTFSFTIQVNDSVNRTVSLPYQIVIH